MLLRQFVARLVGKRCNDQADGVLAPNKETLMNTFPGESHNLDTRPNKLTTPLLFEAERQEKQQTAGLMQAQAIAQSNGWGQSFAQAAASSTAINQCFGQSLGFSQATANANAQTQVRRSHSRDFSCLLKLCCRVAMAQIGPAVLLVACT